VDGVGHTLGVVGCARPMRRLLLTATLLLLLAPAARAETLSYRYGPIHIAPGRNDIVFAPNDLRPPVDGWITGFKPNLSYPDREVPRVDVIHLHHGVWLSNGLPLFAAGEEKTIVRSPPGYGWRYRTSDTWLMNHMIHNLTPSAADVYIDYELEFVPDTAPEAAGMKEVRTLFMGVTPPSAYPVFDVHRGAGGADGRYTYPRESRQKARYNRYVVPQDGVLVGSVGHLHPGGLWTDLHLQRGDRRVRLFRSRARYFEPAGAVSWDVAMEATPPTWRVGVKRGDVLSVSATYDSRRASWYEAMGIMPVAFNPDGTGPDPFAVDVDVRGVLTHGHLPENRNHGGAFSGLADPRRLLSAPPPKHRTIAIRDFVYSRGDLLRTGAKRRPPAIRRGGRLTFVNRDARRGILHSITSCRAPCNRTTGIAYPLADGPVRFDSGNLGWGPTGATAAANRDAWRTPRRLRPGTYTYFCKIHPFMRGSFRVKGPSKNPATSRTAVDASPDRHPNP
jgi:plastocyanin